MQCARKKVDSDGYVYKHGKSRSKELNPESETSSSSGSGGSERRPRTNEADRLQRIEYLTESISDVNTQIDLKKKRREQLSNAHNYGDCEKVSDEITALKQKRFQLEVEINKLKR